MKTTFFNQPLPTKFQSRKCLVFLFTVTIVLFLSVSSAIGDQVTLTWDANDVVDDDFMLVTRWFREEVPTEGDPIASLSETFLSGSIESAARYTPDGEEKGRQLLQTVKERNAEGVIFAAPSFCDPALLDRPMLQNVLREFCVPFTGFKYSENTGQLQPIREQAGTFSDSIKLWSEG